MNRFFVMPGLVPGIHAFVPLSDSKAWITGTCAAKPARPRLAGLRSPVMTEGCLNHFLKSSNLFDQGRAEESEPTREFRRPE
jgi:hypothetical protein